MSNNRDLMQELLSYKTPALRSYAIAEGLPVRQRMRKADIIKMIVDAQQSDSDAQESEQRVNKTTNAKRKTIPRTQQIDDDSDVSVESDYSVSDESEEEAVRDNNKTAKSRRYNKLRQQFNNRIERMDDDDFYSFYDEHY